MLLQKANKLLVNCPWIWGNNKKLLKHLHNCNPDSRYKGSIYFHWPYCAKRCSYCNFNKYIHKKGSYDDTEMRMRHCLVTETRNLLKFCGFQEINSIYFGGGTPSLMRPETVKVLLKEIQQICHFEPVNVEITLECNPDDVQDLEVLKHFCESGINRVSLGVQSLNNDHLKLLNRNHSSEEALKAVENCLQVFPEHSSIDLMFGILSGQIPSSWILELKSILDHFPHLNHISLYQLTLERGTQLFKKVQDGNLVPVSEEDVAEMYTQSIDLLERVGLQRYEISNFARPGHESHHNCWYWSGGDYLGIGPGAHSRITPKLGSSELKFNLRAVDLLKSTKAVSECKDEHRNFSARQSRIQTLEPENWMLEVERIGHGTRKIELQDPLQVVKEFLMTSLRRTEGVTQDDWNRILKSQNLICEEQNNTKSFDQILKKDWKCQQFLEQNLILESEKVFRLSADGLLLVDFITPYIFNAMESNFK